MRIERIGLVVSGIRTKVYDVEKKVLLGTFESRAEASKFTGISASNINEYIRNKTKCRSKLLNAKITFR